MSGFVVDASVAVKWLIEQPLYLDHPVCDCMYLALALREERPVVTADRRSCAAVQGHPYLSRHVVALESLT